MSAGGPKRQTKVFNSAMLASMMDQTPIRAAGQRAEAPRSAEGSQSSSSKLTDSVLKAPILPVRPGQHSHILGRLMDSSGSSSGRTSDGHISSRSTAGVFSAHESPQEEMRRIGSLRKTAPEYMSALMKQGAGLVALAKKGKLPEIIRQTQSAREGELLQYFVAKMAREACAGGHWLIVRYLTQEGFRTPPGVRGARRRPDDPALAPLWAVLGAASRPPESISESESESVLKPGALAVSSKVLKESGSRYSAIPPTSTSTPAAADPTAGTPLGISIGQTHAISTPTPISLSPARGQASPATSSYHRSTHEGDDQAHPHLIVPLSVHSVATASASAGLAMPAGAATGETSPSSPFGEQGSGSPPTSRSPSQEDPAVPVRAHARDTQERLGRRLEAGAAHMQLLAEEQQRNRTIGREGVCIQVLQALLEGGWGFDIAVAESDFSTPLHVAARSGMPVVCAWLVGEAGASRGAADAAGLTPIEVARQSLSVCSEDEESEKARLAAVIDVLEGQLDEEEEKGGRSLRGVRGVMAYSAQDTAALAAAGGPISGSVATSGGTEAAEPADGTQSVLRIPGSASISQVSGSSSAARRDDAAVSGSAASEKQRERQAFIDRDDEWVRQVALAEAQAGRPIHSGWAHIAAAAAAGRLVAVVGDEAASGHAPDIAGETQSAESMGRAVLQSGGVGSGSGGGLMFDTSQSAGEQEPGNKGAASLSVGVVSSGPPRDRGERTHGQARTSGFSLSVDMPPRG